MKKLLLSLQCGLVMFFISAQMKAADNEIVALIGLFDYYLYPDTHTALAGMYIGEDTDVVIPSTVEYQGETYTVTAVSNFIGCFNTNSDITSVTIPNTVTTLGKLTFHDCKSLKRVNIPESITSWDNSIFEGCESLEELHIPAGVTTVPSLEGCSSITNITVSASNTAFRMQDGCLVKLSDMTLVRSVSGIIPSDVTIIGKYAFLGNQNITNAIIPEGVTTIRDHAFDGCTNLRSISFPSTLGGYSIGAESFSYCPALESIVVDTNNTSWTSRNSLGEECNALINTANENLCLGCKTTDFSKIDNVHVFDNYAFKGCTGLISAIIPEGVMALNDRVFVDCPNLTTIHLPSTIYSVSQSVMDCPSLIRITVDPANTTYDSRNDCNAVINTSSNKLEFGCNSTVIPNDIESIESYAFCGSNISSVTLPTTLTNIRNNAFQNSAITSIALPDGVTSIPSDCFNGCSNLVSCTVPATLNSIGSKAFYGCSSLSSFDFPESITSIGANAFTKCASLREVVLQNGTASYSSRCFQNCGVERVVLPNNLNTIPDAMFASCRNLKEVVWPETLTKIKECAFANSGLETVILPDTDDEITIGNFAFSMCPELEYIDFKTINIDGLLCWFCPNLRIATGAILLPMYFDGDDLNLPNDEITQAYPLFAGAPNATIVSAIPESIWETLMTDIDLFANFALSGLDEEYLMNYLKNKYGDDIFDEGSDFDPSTITDDDKMELLSLIFSWYIDNFNRLNNCEMPNELITGLALVSILSNAEDAEYLRGDLIRDYLSNYEQRKSEKAFKHYFFSPYLMNVSAANMATAYLPIDTKLPDGMTMEYCSEVKDNSVVLDDISGNVVPAETGVVLKAQTGWKPFFMTDNIEMVEKPQNSLLTGVLEDTPLSEVINSDENIYVLSPSSLSDYNDACFRKANNSIATLSKYKAYLVTNLGAGAKILNAIHADGNTTGIDTISEKSIEKDIYYDLSGRSVTKPSKGIYIYNGKKVIF